MNFGATTARGDAGIRYPSRFNPAWDCWAIFDDRFVAASDRP
jgi:hypothetical protein